MATDALPRTFEDARSELVTDLKFLLDRRTGLQSLSGSFNRDTHNRVERFLNEVDRVPGGAGRDRKTRGHSAAVDSTQCCRGFC